MFSPIEEIKSRLDIVEFIQGYVRMQKAGINFKANCPFHGEKTPSFFVSPTRQMWHCFGCGRGGDIFKFLMEIEGHDFPEALRMLAQRAGIVLKREDPRIRSERNLLYDINEEASKIFAETLKRTPAVMSYLKKRGMEDATIQKFNIGFAPQSWDFLIKALGAKGFKKEDCEKAGLVLKSEDKSSWYDRFRSRIMFPISDANGRVIGFGGRIFETESSKKEKNSEKTEAKYVNTPNTLVYDKSRVLYGFEHAKQDIREKNSVVLVEGYMDCVMSHQARVLNTVAVSGTALTPHQLKILKRICEKMIASFDTDQAGDFATKRSLSLAAEFDFERLVAVIPSGKDPADTVLENPQAWRDAVSQAKLVVEFYFEKAFREFNPKTADGKKAIAALVLPYVAELSHEIEKAHWVGEIAKRFGIAEDSVWKELSKKIPSARTHEINNHDESAVSLSVPKRRDLLEERVLALFTVVDKKISIPEMENRYITFVSALHEELYGTLRGAMTEALPTHLKDTYEMFRFKSEILGQLCKDIEGEFRISARELEKECIRARLLDLGGEIERHEKTGNHDVVGTLLHDFRSLSDKLKLLS